MKKTLLVAACSFALDATSPHLVLIPEGIFRGIDGRPTDAPHWELTPERGRQIAAALNQRSIDLVVDYEHATLKAQESGDPAPASGWLKPAGFQYIDGVGLCSTLFEWTEKAKGYIEAKEYKYTSPVFFYNKAGEVLGLHSFALTNTPNLDTLPEARLAAAAQDFLSQQSDEDSTMKEFLELMRKKLGLTEAATDEELVVAANSAFAKMDGAFGTTLATDQTLEVAIDKAIEVKTAANSQATVDPTKYVPMAVYQEAVANANTAASKAATREIEDLITAACRDGRLTGQATIDWIKEQAKTNPEFAKSHIESLPKIAALSQKQTTTVDLNKPTPQTDELKDDVLSMLGVSAADVEKYGA
ncbi:phage protease [Acinetobacter haemolyticus]|uniref:phage protease n=1 Tax=Acinetobacter haemolyticus TaxID=29430 RepID=UPI002A6B2450|nr:phage protease [Acinetobacter haemolyticus]WPO67568.1 phage protease [Acinetobacter haemolyticus]